MNGPRFLRLPDVPLPGERAAFDFLGRALASVGDAPVKATAELVTAAGATVGERFPTHLDAGRLTLDL